jgi:hypothetical protein
MARYGRDNADRVLGSAGWNYKDENSTEAKLTKKRRKIKVTVRS